MKLYKNLVNAVAQTLQEIFLKKRYADKALESAFKQNPQWGSRDRRFVAEGVYDIVRNYRLHATLAGSEKNFWFMTAQWLVLRGIELPAWPEFQHVNVAQILADREQLRKHPAISGSWPDWLWNLAIEELGEAGWQQEAEAMNQQADVFIRANRLKTSVTELKDKLKHAGIESETVSGVNDALRLTKRDNLFKTTLFADGFFEVQDAGSQLISEFLEPAPGETIIDACAGAGGKSLHLAGLMKNKGRIVSMDVENFKLEELKKRARRAGAFNIETRLIEGDKTIRSLAGKADRVLLDVPCSGLGVIKRNPDAKWKLSPEVISRTREIQQQILNSYCNMVRPGGYMVYSTCSILPSENRGQVDLFLSGNERFELLREKTILPHEGFDGFYMALMRHRG